MALTDEQKQLAKTKAVAFLEKNIFNLGLVLGVDVDELDADYEIPVVDTDPEYSSYVALVRMSENLRKLESEQ